MARRFSTAASGKLEVSTRSQPAQVVGIRRGSGQPTKCHRPAGMPASRASRPTSAASRPASRIINLMTRTRSPPPWRLAGRSDDRGGRGGGCHGHGGDAEAGQHRRGLVAGGGHGDPGGVDGHGAGGAGGGEELPGGGGGAWRVEPQYPAGAVGDGVDLLGAGAGGLLGQVVAVGAGGEDDAAAEDDRGEDDGEEGGEYHPHRGQPVVAPVRGKPWAAAGWRSGGDGRGTVIGGAGRSACGGPWCHAMSPPRVVVGTPAWAGPRPTVRYRSIGLVEAARVVTEPGMLMPVRPWVVTVQATVTVTAPPRWNALVSTVTDRLAHCPARLAVAALRAAVVAVGAVRARDAARAAAARS